jgi:REP element-mobilizing transposase RayT
MERFGNKYRIPSIRSKNWDYGGNGKYFITICTENKIGWFGEIKNGVLKLSDIGKYAHQCWMDIPKHFPFVHLDEFVIMPNHVHGIIVIDKPNVIRCGNTNEKRYGNENDIRHGNENVETQNFASLQSDFQNESGCQNESRSNPISNPQNPSNKNIFGPQSKNLASVIRGFKTGVTMYARKLYPVFEWQPRFYEHIIHDCDSLQKIRYYIIHNPENFAKDRFYK